MSGPDGPEQREAFAQEQSCAEDDRIETLDDRAEGEMMDVAQAKMMSWAIDRVLG